MERCLRVLVGMMLGTMLLASPIFAAKDEAPDKEAAALVARAFEAGLAGDLERRQSLLTEAIKVSPDYAPAHWQLGHVLHEGKWLPAAEAAAVVGKDERYAEYRKLRDAQWTTAAGQLLLARWCQKKGLTQEAQLHWRGVLLYDPDNAEAIKALGLHKYRNHWLTLEQIDEIKRLEAISEQSRDRWKAKLERWAETIEKRRDGRDDALAQLRAIDDPAAVLWLERLVSPRSSELGLEVVARLATMDAPAATYSLVRHAVLSEFPEVREAATAELRQRPLDSFVGVLVESLTAPPQLKVSTVYSPLGNQVGTVRHAFQQNSNLVVERLWDIQDIGDQISLAGAQQITVTDRVTGSYAVREEDPRLLAKQLASRTRKLKESVDALEAKNIRICELLQSVTDQDFGRDQGKWWQWWLDRGEREGPGENKPVDVRRASQVVRKGYAAGVQPSHASCFAATTPVHTKNGVMAIVDIKPGDLVLSQDPVSGQLAFRPVVATTIRPAKRTVLIETANDAIEATAAHPFWVTSEGWKIAKQLACGDSLQSLNSSATVINVSSKAEEISAYNLVVADFATYFVGKEGLLVHDNSPVVHQGNPVPGLSGN